MKAMIVGCVVHRFSINLVNIVKTSEKSCVYWEIVKMSFWISIDVYISPRFPLWSIMLKR